MTPKEIEDASPDFDLAGQRNDRIDVSGAACGQNTGDERDACQNRRRHDEHQRIGCARGIELTLQTLPQREGPDSTEKESGGDEREAFAHDEPKDFPSAASERDPDTNLFRPLSDDVSED